MPLLFWRAFESGCFKVRSVEGERNDSKSLVLVLPHWCFGSKFWDDCLNLIDSNVLFLCPLNLLTKMSLSIHLYHTMCNPGWHCFMEVKEAGLFYRRYSAQVGCFNSGYTLTQMQSTREADCVKHTPCFRSDPSWPMAVPEGWVAPIQFAKCSPWPTEPNSLSAVWLLVWRVVLFPLLNSSP